MRHKKKRWKVRAHDAQAESAFERALLGEIESDRKSFDPRQDRKTLQLCRQVQRALMLALSGECSDDVLRDVYVDSVEPMGGPSQLLVRVCVPNDANAFDVLARLDRHSSNLRMIVAQSICRKRAPSLVFATVPAGNGGLP